MAGAKPNFTKYDVLLTFFQLHTPCSRAFLVHSVGVGEGSMRSILDRLKEKEFIISSKKGHELTQKGKDVFDKLLSVIDPPVAVHSDHYKQLSQTAIIIKTKTSQNVSVLQRDQAIANGAKAALILSYQNHKLSAPQIKENFSSIASQLDLSENNVVVVCFAQSLPIAQKAALAVAVHFSKQIEKIAEQLVQ